jgi:hypothetical protein
MYKELKRMWKEAVMVELKVLFPHVAGGTGEYYETP